MKRIVLAILVLILTLTAGCSKGDSGAPGFGKDDLYLDIDGTRYFLNTGIETVVEALGSDYEYSEARSCDYDGMDKTFIYDTAVFYTYPLSEKDMVNEIYTEDPLAATSKGIRVGASKDDVLAAYGNNCEDTQYQLIYNLSDQQNTDGGSLCFNLEGGEITAIYITMRAF